MIVELHVRYSYFDNLDQVLILVSLTLCTRESTVVPLVGCCLLVMSREGSVFVDYSVPTLDDTLPKYFICLKYALMNKSKYGGSLNFEFTLIAQSVTSMTDMQHEATAIHCKSAIVSLGGT